MLLGQEDTATNQFSRDIGAQWMRHSNIKAIYKVSGKKEFC